MDGMEQPGSTSPHSGRTPEGSAASRRNAIDDGSRSISEFPPEMAERIAAKEKTLKAELKPRNELESMAITELARASIQHVHCEDQVIRNEARVIADVDLSWNDDQRAHINRVGGRLGKAPDRVAPALEQSRQGAEWCVDRWRGLAQAVAAHGRLTDEQRALAFDLMGISVVLRAGTQRVPAADDAEGLKAFIDQQIERLETRIETELKDRDVREQERARHGLPRIEDAQTRKLRSNANRAYRRFVTALESFRQLRLDLPPAPGTVKGRTAPAPAPPTAPAPPSAPAPADSTAATARTGPWWREEPADRAAAAHEKQKRQAERIRRNTPQSNIDAAREATAAASGSGAR
jgi:hypothetical protein